MTCDVVIVGAGSAGLSAAKTAAENGLNHVVLEASHRIGGRAYTEMFSQDVPFDLGCHWMHSASINPFVQIAEDLGFRYRRDMSLDNMAHRIGVRLSDAEVREIDALEEANDRAIREAAERCDDAVVDVIDLDSPWAPYWNYWFSLSSSHDPDEVSVRDTVNYNDTDEDWPVVDGYGALVSRWADDVSVQYNSPVERIRTTRDGVDVVSTQGTISARTVVVTVSTGVLAARHIAFEPTLPEWKLAAIDDLPLGVHNRIAVRLQDDDNGIADKNWWTTVQVESDGTPMGVQLRPYGHGYAVGVTGGRFGAWLERAGVNASVECLVEHMRSAWGNDIVKQVTDRNIVTAWAGDPLTLGSYSAAKPGRTGQRLELARPLDDRIYFAGEATIPDAYSTCHGAYLSGQRAMREVCDYLKPRA